MKRRTILVVGAMLIGASCTAPGTVAGPGSSSELLPQPPVGDLSVASEDQRVDITAPRFSNPTSITNPLFPVSSQESVLLVGKVDGERFRTEVTLLPYTRILEWRGQRVEVLVSQYVAYLSGRLHEVAYDLYAQADDGSVWYFGEDVFNFRDGTIADTHGTWIAGQDGPAAMIMPGDPQPGDVYRPENIPGLVFEEVTVKAIDRSLDGPFGPVEGGLLIEELHMDGATEDKTFAPGYGEFYTSGGGDVEALAMAVPTDAVPVPVPAELAALRTAAMTVFESARSADWSGASAAMTEMRRAWEAHRSGDLPALVGPILNTAIDSLASAVKERDAAAATQSAIEASQSILDLHLRYAPPIEVDVARFDLWLTQMELDAAARDGNAVNGDFFSLDYIRDRILPALTGETFVEFNLGLEELLGAVGDNDFASVAAISERLRVTLDGVESVA